MKHKPCVIEEKLGSSIYLFKDGVILKRRIDQIVLVLQGKQYKQGNQIYRKK